MNLCTTKRLEKHCNDHSNLFENCISCEEKTNILKIQNVDSRRFYVDGAGQLCERCWGEIYKINKID